MSDADLRPGSEDLALDIFAAYLRDKAPGETIDVEPLCRLHPDHAGALQECADAFAERDQAFRKAGHEDQALSEVFRSVGSETPWRDAAIDVYQCYLLTRRESGGTFEELQNGHPEYASDLARLHEHWNRVSSALADLGEGARLDETQLLKSARQFLGGADQSRARSLLRALFARREGATRYVVGAKIGSGGMGTIFEVTDPVLRRRLAMKFPDGGGVDRESLNRGGTLTRKTTRFLEEAQVTGQLDHPNIVPVHELGIDSSGRPYFTMKLVRGSLTLSGVFEKAAREADGWTRSRVIEAILRICDAVSYAHAKGVVHRDLKPANVMVGSFGEVYVMDWGLAQVVGARVQRATQTDLQSSLVEVDADETPPGSARVEGTPWFMPPEQARGDAQSVSVALDIYAVGAILYTLLAGRKPFELDDSEIEGLTQTQHIMEVLRRARTEQPMSISELAPGTVAPELIAITERAMARDPGARYPTMQGLSDDLRRYLDDRVVLAYRTGPAAELRKWGRRNRSHAAGALSVIASLLLGLTMFSGVLQAQKTSAVAAEQQALQELEQEQVTMAALREESARLQGAVQELQEVKVGLESRAAKAKERSDEMVYVAGIAEAKAVAAKAEVAASEAEASVASGQLKKIVARVGLETERWERLSLERRVNELLASPLIGSPICSSNQDSVEAWLASADEIERLLARVHADRRDLVGKGTTPLPGELADLRRTSPLVRSIDAGEVLLESLIRERDGAVADLKHDGLNPRLVELRAVRDHQIADVEGRLASDRKKLSDWTPLCFDDDLNSWRFGLVERLLAAGDRLIGARQRMARRRGVYAEFLRALQQDAKLWKEACRRIGDIDEFPLYGGRELAPQAGLRPLGPLERAGQRLYQFTVVGSGEAPQLDQSGEWEVLPETALVLVLVPGGSCCLGASRESLSESLSESTAEFDPTGRSDETPPALATELDWYFIGRHEVTQAQWGRIADGDEPSLYHVEVADRRRSSDGAHPVESISWVGAMDGLTDVGLTLPTEAQWEHAVRAGKLTKWWSGTSRNEIFRDVVPNLADRGCEHDSRRKIEGWRYESDYDNDPHDYHAPVAARGARRHPWGLDRVIGNVAEWCRDPYLERYDFAASRAGDGLRDAPKNDLRVVRGGSFKGCLAEGRSAARRAEFCWSRLSDVGLRVSRQVDPD